MRFLLKTIGGLALGRGSWTCQLRVPCMTGRTLVCSSVVMTEGKRVES